MLTADLDQLTEHGLITMDEDTGELLIPSWIDRDGTYKRRNQLRAAKHDAGLIQSERLRLVLAEALREIDLSQVKADKVGKDGQTERDRVEPMLTEMYAMLNPNGDVQIYDAPNSVGDSVPNSVPNPLQDPVTDYSETSSPTTPGTSSGTSSEVLANCSGTRAGAGAR
ncbi:MAG: hypothetical protein L0L18_07270, partial [Acidipropionibacterium jensenii]|nr:hypothetical protein [Acidipropionibacterium jensenii]